LWHFSATINARRHQVNDCGFKLTHHRNLPDTQVVLERSPEKAGVGGSIPSLATI
jgi:hypothetical protein